MGIISKIKNIIGTKEAKFTVIKKENKQKENKQKENIKKKHRVTFYNVKHDKLYTYETDDTLDKIKEKFFANDDEDNEIYNFEIIN